LHHHYCINQAFQSPSKDQANSHNFIISQLDLGVDREADESPQIFEGWAIRPHPFGGYTLENSHHDYILGCFATTAAAAKFAAYLPPAADCNFGSIQLEGVA
jgi:hypothetical protein